MGLIMFNGLSSEDFGFKVWQPPDYQIPEKEYETIHIPGRDGDLVIDKESFKNTLRSYVVSFGKTDRKDFTLLANKLSEWLNSAHGYARLEDSYEPEYYRQALYQKTISIKNVYEQAGCVTIEFNCKPQRFLKSGDNVIRIEKQIKVITDENHGNVTDSQNGNVEGCCCYGYLRNPTAFKSRPTIKIYGFGSGELEIGDQVLEISSIDNYLVIDCEMMEIYKDKINCNSKVKLNRNDFPKLLPGLNRILFSGGITSVEVIPKWWTI